MALRGVRAAPLGRRRLTHTTVWAEPAATMVTVLPAITVLRDGVTTSCGHKATAPFDAYVNQFSRLATSAASFESTSPFRSASPGRYPVRPACVSETVWSKGVTRPSPSVSPAASPHTPVSSSAPPAACTVKS